MHSLFLFSAAFDSFTSDSVGGACFLVHSDVQVQNGLKMEKCRALRATVCGTMEKEEERRWMMKVGQEEEEEEAQLSSLKATEFSWLQDERTQTHNLCSSTKC